MKRIVFAISLLAVCIAVAAAQSAEEIVHAARNRIESDTVSSRSRMIISARDGGTTERLVDQYSSDADGRTRTVIIFHRPASVAGTRFLTIENPGREEDRWIFLPSLGRVRRIAGGEGSGSFVGTDFSYDDVSAMDRDVDEDTHRILREERLEGRDFWVIESVPKDPGYQYSRMISWIEKGTMVMRKVEMFDRRGALVKVLDILRLEDRQGRLTPVETRMSSVQAGTSTTIFTEIIKYDDPIPAGVFTTRFLETGRP